MRRELNEVGIMCTTVFSWQRLFYQSLCFGIFCPELGMQIVNIVVQVMFLDLFSIGFQEVIFAWHHARVVSPFQEGNDGVSQLFGLLGEPFSFRVR